MDQRLKPVPHTERPTKHRVPTTPLSHNIVDSNFHSPTNDGNKKTLQLGKFRAKIWRQSSRIKHIIGDLITCISQYNQTWMMTWVTLILHNTIRLLMFSRESQ